MALEGGLQRLRQALKQVDIMEGSLHKFLIKSSPNPSVTCWSDDKAIKVSCGEAARDSNEWQHNAALFQQEQARREDASRNPTLVLARTYVHGYMCVCACACAQTRTSAHANHTCIHAGADVLP